jgi:hypothetical protein
MGAGIAPDSPLEAQLIAVTDALAESQEALLILQHVPFV